MATATLPQLPGHNQYLVGRLPSSKGTSDKRPRLTDESLPPARRAHRGLVTNDAAEEPRTLRSSSARKGRTGPKPPHRLPKLQTLVNGKYDQDGKRMARDRRSYHDASARGHTKSPSDESKSTTSSLAEAKTHQEAPMATPPQRDEDGPDKSSRPEKPQHVNKSPEPKYPMKPQEDDKPKPKHDIFYAKERKYSAGPKPPPMDRFSHGPGTIQSPKQIKPSLPAEARRPAPKKQDDDTSQFPPGPRRIFHAPTLIVNEKKTHLYPPRHVSKVPLVSRRKPEPPDRSRKPGRSYDKPWILRASTLPPRRERVRTAARIKRTGTQFSVKGRVNRDGSVIYNTDRAVRIYNNKDKTNDWLRRGLSRADTKSIKPTREKSLAIYTDPARKIPPWHRKEYVLSRNEASMYNHIHHTYGNGDIKKARVKRFYNQLEELQLENWKKAWDKEMDKKRGLDKTKRKQQWQLKHVRDKFEEDRYKRYMSQYVTTRVLDYEWATRHVYGLPEDINDDPQRKVKLKRRKTAAGQTFDTDVQYKKNTKKYNPLFNIHHGPDWDRYMKRPKMAGIDTVELDDGKGKKVAVKSVVGDAQKMLESESDDDDLSIDIGSDSDTEPRKRRSKKDEKKDTSKSPHRQTLSPKKIYMRPPSPVQSKSRSPIKQKVLTKRPSLKRAKAGKRANVPTKFGAKVSETQKGQYHIKRKGPKDRDGWVPRAETVDFYTEVEPGKKPTRQFKDYVELKNAKDDGAPSDKENDPLGKAQYVSTSSDLYGKGYHPSRPRERRVRKASPVQKQDTGRPNSKPYDFDKANNGRDSKKPKEEDNTTNATKPVSKGNLRKDANLGKEESNNSKKLPKDDNANRKTKPVGTGLDKSTSKGNLKKDAPSKSDEKNKAPRQGDDMVAKKDPGSKRSEKDASTPKPTRNGDVATVVAIPTGNEDEGSLPTSKETSRDDNKSPNMNETNKRPKENLGNDDKNKGNSDLDDGKLGKKPETDATSDSKGVPPAVSNDVEDNATPENSSKPAPGNHQESVSDKLKDGNSDVGDNSKDDVRSNKSKSTISKSNKGLGNEDDAVDRDVKGNDRSEDANDSKQVPNKIPSRQTSRSASGKDQEVKSHIESDRDLAKRDTDTEDQQTQQANDSAKQCLNESETKNTRAKSSKSDRGSAGKIDGSDQNELSKNAGAKRSSRERLDDEDKMSMNKHSESKDGDDIKSVKSGKKRMAPANTTSNNERQTPPPSRKSEARSSDKATDKAPAAATEQTKKATPETKSRKTTPSNKNKNKQGTQSDGSKEENKANPKNTSSKNDKKNDKKDQDIEKKQKKKKPKTPLENLRLPPSPEPPKADPYRRDVPSADLESDSDDDIFERARKKYGIVLDSDEDD